MGTYIGIDLGTTFSSIAKIDDTGRPVIVSNSEGQNLTPSCVMVEDNVGDAIQVGEEARKVWGTDKTMAAARFKRKMGESKTYKLGEHTFTPTDLSALVLKKLRQDAEKQTGEIADAVVTIPANFPNEAREATMVAARNAGLNIKYIINEPTAAALYYAFKSGEELRGVYAVYDLGGGTFDISIIQVNGQEVNVLASHGVRELGGDDFDRALREVVGKKYEAETGKQMTPRDYLENNSEEDKKSLSKLKSVKGIEVKSEVFEVTRKEFEDSISGFIAQTEMLCEAALDEAKLEAGDIKGVFLAGGSTRIPAVRESVKRVFQQEPIDQVNVDEVVALGAALYAAFKSDGSSLSSAQKNAIKKIKFTEVVNKYFGVISVHRNQDRGQDELQNSILIQKGEKIPCSVTKPFYTMDDNQEKIRCTITEAMSPETDPKFVTKIGERVLEVPPGRPAGQEIKVTFFYDENQIMHCKFLDVASGREETKSISMASTDDSSADEIEKFTVE